MIEERYPLWVLVLFVHIRLDYVNSYKGLPCDACILCMCVCVCVLYAEMLNHVNSSECIAQWSNDNRYCSTSVREFL